MDETTNTLPNPSTTPTPLPNNGTSQDTRTIVTVLLLIFVSPVGLLLMWFWSKWKVWVKILVSIPLVVILPAVMASVVLVAVNPKAQIEKARQTEIKNNCTRQCRTASDDASCVTNCLKTESSKILTN